MPHAEGSDNSCASGSAAQAQANYDRLAPWYDLLSGGAEARLTRRCVALLALRPGERVLDLGCGTGAALPGLRRAVAPGGLAVGLDLSAGMLSRARRRLLRVGAPAALARGDAWALPLAQDCLDALLLSFTLELFDEEMGAGVLAECRRVLRPGGRLGVVAVAQGRGPMARLYAWAHRRWSEVIDCRPLAAERLLRGQGWLIAVAERHSLWGLPVQIVVATP